MLEAVGVLAAEFVRKPAWGVYHLWGFIDQRLLMDRHQKLPREPHVRPLVETVANYCGVDVAAVREVVAEADRFLTGAAVNRGPDVRVIGGNSDASRELQNLLYAVTRLTKPRVVVEVGVGRGATTAVLLSALDANDHGHLHSIEFPSLRVGYSNEIGALVPEQLRSRWTLVWGPSQHILPRLLKTIGPVDLYVHDGGHTYYTQYPDFDNMAPHLAPGGLAVFDDVNNDAFLEIAEKRKMHWALVRQGKKDLAGMAIARGRVAGK